MKGSVLEQACKQNKVSLVIRLLGHKDIISMDIHHSILLAYEGNNVEMMKILLADPRVHIRQIFDTICCDENIGILELLLKHPGIDFASLREDLLPYLAQRGKNKVVQLLLNDPRIKDQVF